MNQNKVSIIGRLTAQPVLRDITSGSVCNLSVAVNGLPNKQTGVRPVDYIPVSVFGKQAISCATHLLSGQEVSVEGRMHFRKQKIGDKNVTVAEVIASHVEFGAKPKSAMAQAAA